MAASPRIAVLVSGRGSNLQSLIDAHAQGHIPASFALVLSNIENAYALTRAQSAGIPTSVVSHTDYPSRDAFDEALHQTLTAHQIDFVCLAGFMRILTPAFVEKWHGRMINIHPSLLPKFKGLHTHQRAIDAGETVHGCTIHWVTSELDSGAIIAQATVPVLANDTAEILATRVLEAENTLYPKTLAALLAARS